MNSYLIPAFAIATLFPQLLPGPVQLTELIFLLALVAYRRELPAAVRRYPWLAVASVGYCLVNFLAAWQTEGAFWGADTSTGSAGSAGAMKEAAGRAYLAVVPFLVVAHVARFGRHELEQWWVWGTVAVCSLALGAYAIVAAGGADPWHWLAYIGNYPYLGGIFRLSGPAPTYGMFYMLALPGLLLAWRDWRAGSGFWWAWAIIMVAGLLTFGKEILLLPIGALLLEGFRSSAPRQYLAYAGAAMLATVLLLGTHFLLVRPGTALADTAYTSGRVMRSGENWQLLETNYTTNKRAALLLAARSPWLGVGPGCFATSTLALVETGDYPAHFGRFDPHSTYTGALAETGWLGLLFLLAVLYAFWHYRPDQAGVWSVLLLLFLLAAVFKDVANFRSLWVVLGMVLVDSGGKRSVVN